jgi:NADPH-dependent 2,4-dienoyl-CoA reductase/sulfur reductase-like enzyme
MLGTTRRQFLRYAGAASALALPACAQVASRPTPKVVVVGGGFGGATAARWVKRFDPAIDVTLIEADRSYVTCPFSNYHLAGFRTMESITHGFAGFAAAGVRVVHGTATSVDTAKKVVATAGGGAFAYDRLIVAPGIDIKFGAVPGYTEAAQEAAPHAWKAGPQTVLLRKQLEAMADGGVVVMAVPADPFRCPPGPYERASMIAHYIKTQKPKSKLIILDAKDAFSKQGLFREGWNIHYKDIIKWVPLKEGGKAIEVDAKTLTVKTDFDSHKAAVLNFIPPQQAAAIAHKAGLANQTGWCPINHITFESTLVKDVHVIGDAAIVVGMPKSGHSANTEAKACAAAVVTLIKGQPPAPPVTSNVCYSLITPDYGISVTNVWTGSADKFTANPGGGVSPTGRDAEFRRQEAQFAMSWYANITREIWG